MEKEGIWQVDEDCTVTLIVLSLGDALLSLGDNFTKTVVNKYCQSKIPKPVNFQTPCCTKTCKRHLKAWDDIPCAYPLPHRHTHTHTHTDVISCLKSHNVTSQLQSSHFTEGVILADSNNKPSGMLGNVDWYIIQKNLLRMLDSEEDGVMFFRDFGKYLPVDIVQVSKTPESSGTLL